MAVAVCKISLQISWIANVKDKCKSAKLLHSNKHLQAIDIATGDGGQFNLCPLCCLILSLGSGGVFVVFYLRLNWTCSRLAMETAKVHLSPLSLSLLSCKRPLELSNFVHVFVVVSSCHPRISRISNLLQAHQRLWVDLSSDSWAGIVVLVVAVAVSVAVVGSFFLSFAHKQARTIK